MKFTLFLFLAGALGAQTFRPLHVSPVGMIVDDTGTMVLLRGLNRSGTGSGNADASATDQEYGAQNQLLSMNLVRLFVNAAWWNANVQVPIAGVSYQSYVDQLIQRSKAYGNYVLIVKAGQFPDPPCGADGRNCPAANQGDLNCQANPSVCPAQDTSGAYLSTALTFWNAFAKKYAGDAAVLYDTWEDMHGLDAATWSTNESQLIAAIRTNNPQALIFVEDTGTAFESIVSGAMADLAGSNLVWSFHLYNGPVSGACNDPESVRYRNWPQNFDPLIEWTRQKGHAAAITEWGGCNDTNPYHNDIASYATAHYLPLVYFDSSKVMTLSEGVYQLNTFGLSLATAYTAIAKAGAPANNGGPELGSASPVQDAENFRTKIVPGSWASIYGRNFSYFAKDWSDQDFSKGLLPTSVLGVQVLVNGTPAPVWYVSPTQINFQAPTNISGTATVSVVHNGISSAQGSFQVVASSPAVICYSADNLIFYPSAQIQGFTGVLGDPAVFGPGFKKAKPGDVIQFYVTGLASTQSGVTIPAAIPFTTPVTIGLGSTTLTPSYVGQVGPGYYQINFTVPAGLAAGNYPFGITLHDAASQYPVMLVVGP